MILTISDPSMTFVLTISSIIEYICSHTGSSSTFKNQNIRAGQHILLYVPRKMVGGVPIDDQACTKKADSKKDFIASEDR